ncbi:queuosine salvage protein-like isoform X1 [Lingula anatina]|uniref:Queuosine 5'-phosphate N-glycosylase/hydrolase n=1 Tax=Lingula anatina TaxID=7574 RepID=A0A1S3JQ90_LINAN|nr:queuosine salvage protein-like isoform X1 [Lingula anatina]|eukprot:XP_013412543.1 queuosine salvage protein-like isoform X1 [Lingula anatina]
MSKAVLLPRAGGKLIAQHSKDVSINTEGVKKLAAMLLEKAKKREFFIGSWRDHTLNPKTSDEKAINWIFLCDTLNFSFWSKDENNKFMVRYKGKEYTGYWSLCAAINRAIDEGTPITDPNYYSKMTMDQLKHVMRSDSAQQMPLLEERLCVVHEAGKVLVEKYNESFVTCLKQANQSAQDLLKLVVRDFSSYRDEVDFEGQKVGIYKRVQILIADIWACCLGEGLGNFDDIDTITMFADYRIPQALVYFGVLEYSDALWEMLKSDATFRSGDRLEVEIRGCSIWATELVNQEIQDLMAADEACGDITVNSILIDHFLWDYRREHAEEMNSIPIHKIRCIYY